MQFEQYLDVLAQAEDIISIQNELISRLGDLIGCYQRDQPPPAGLTERIAVLRGKLI
jgi:hypothetical protein